MAHEPQAERLPEVAGRREWIGLAVIALPCLLYSMDLTVLNLALPSISADLGPSSSELLWIVDIYGFLLAGALIPMGVLGDRIGRRRLLLIGAALFGAASVLAAFSTSAAMLIATRALLGIAGATLAPSTLSLIRNMFLDARQRTFAIGVWATSFSVGAAIGPLVGGLLLERYSWGAAFLVGVPVMLLLLVLGPLMLPEFRDPRARRIDVWSAAMSLASILFVIYGLKWIATHGWGSLPAASIAAGLAVGAAFVRRQRTLADPLIDLRLFRIPAFSAALATNTLSLLIAFSSFLFYAQYLQLVVGLSPLHAGLWTVPSSGGFVVGSMLTPVVVRRASPALVMAVALALAALGFVALAQVEPTSGLALAVSGTVLLSLGVAPVVTLSTDLIVGTAPPERAGAASAISETCAELGGALGIAVLGSVGNAVYRTRMADAVLTDVSSASATAARDTLSGAVSLAAQLPGSLGAPLLDQAREGFTAGLQLVAIIAAILAVALAVVAGALLRGAGAADSPHADVG